MFQLIAKDRRAVLCVYVENTYVHRGGVECGLSEKILNNSYIVAPGAKFSYAKCNYALGVFACSKTSSGVEEQRVCLW